VYPPPNQHPPQGFAPQAGGAFGAPPQGAFSTPGGGSNYEFNEMESVVIRELADNVNFYGMFGLVFGSLGTLGSLVTLFTQGFRGVSSLVAVLGLVVQGVFARGAATRFRAVADTQGNDIPNMLAALADLQRFYLVMAGVGVCTSLASVWSIISQLIAGF
jgi:hypothetical protein